ncbi:succinate dehydrogenase- cytochrome b556 subunit [Apiospora saccharicola]
MNVSRVGVRALQQEPALIRVNRSQARCLLLPEPPSRRDGRQGNHHHPDPPRLHEQDNRDRRPLHPRRPAPAAPHLPPPAGVRPGADVVRRLDLEPHHGRRLQRRPVRLRRGVPGRPLFGWHIESASMAAAFGSLPLAIKGSLKFLMAWPFAFHGINSMRHLTWDTAKGFSKKSVQSGGYAILGASVVSALGLVLFM